MSSAPGDSATATHGPAVSRDRAGNTIHTHELHTSLTPADTRDAGGAVVVTFFTQSYALHMPEQAYSVPLTVLPEGLSSLVQTVLGVPESEQFDFLLHDEYIGTSLQRFLHRRGIRYEDILHLEYTPALHATEGIFVPQDDWPSSVRAPYAGCADVLLTGSYDHCVRLLRCNSCVALGTFHTGCVKEVCVVPPSSYSTRLLECDAANGHTHDEGGGGGGGSYKRRRGAASSSSCAGMTNTNVSSLSSSLAEASSAHATSRRNHDNDDNDNRGDFYFVSCSQDGSIAGWHVQQRRSAAAARIDTADDAHRRRANASAPASPCAMRVTGSIHAHADAIESVDVAAVVGSSDNVAHLLDNSSNEGNNNHHDNDSALMNAEALVATASWDTSVKLFRWSQLLTGLDTLPSRQSPLLTFTDHTRPVLCCRFSAALGAERLYSAGLDGTVKLMDVSVGQLQATLAGDHAVRGLALRPAAQVNIPSLSSVSMTAAAAAGGADLVLTANTDNRARFYDSRQKAVIKTFAGHRQWLYAATWLWRADEEANNSNSSTAPGVLFATASEDATVRVYDLRCTSSPLLVMDGLHTDGVLDVTYAGKSMVASCGKDNKVKSFSLARAGGDRQE